MPPASRFIRVLIVDRHAVARQGLKALLGQTRSFDVAESDTVEAATDAARERQPDIILLATSDPVEITALAAASPTSKIIVLGLHADPLYARRALDTGATAYLPREQIDGDLAAILEDTAGQTPDR